MIAALVTAGCGGDDVAAPARGPSLPADLVPRELDGGALTVVEDPSARKAFERTERTTLVADGKLWAIRKGETLVATLQVATLDPRVDLTRRADREQIVASALAGGVETVEVAGTTVHAVASQDRVMFLWFGRRLFEVLQVKATKVDPQDLLNEVLGYQTSSPSWEPLVISEEEGEVEE